MKKRPRFTTIPFSHYCGLARWALNRSAIDFFEDKFAPGFQLLPARLRGGKRTVPVLEFPGGKIQGSQAIAVWADASLPTEKQLWSQAQQKAQQELLQLMDRGLGPATRRVAYGYLLEHKDFIDLHLRSQLPKGRAFRWKLFDGGVERLLRWALNINDEGVARSKLRVQQIFQDVEQRLEETGAYLAGPNFGASDLAFAALAAPILVPKQDETLPDLSLCPDAFREYVESLQTTPAAKHAYRVWEQHRHEVVV